LSVIPYAGIQNDESLVGAPLYLQNPKDLSFVAFHHTIPLMVMTYIGTLKTLIYIPILAVFGSGVWALRIPTVLIGALTIFFFFRLALRLDSSLAASIGGILLATDPIFLLTNTIDWGPVALSQFLLVTGSLCVVRFCQARTDLMRDLGLGFFLFGLGLWNKALFYWILAGLAAATILVLRAEVKRVTTWTSAAIAILAFIVGASPFILYNVRHPNATLSTSAHFDTPSFAMQKFPALTGTLDGSGLLGYFTTESWDVPNPKTPASLHGKLAWWVERTFGSYRHTGLGYALAGSILLIPWWWRRRVAWFALIFMAVTWASMALTHDAGGSVHHAVLLWPFPHLFLGVTLASITAKHTGAAKHAGSVKPIGKRVAMVAAAVLVGMNLLVLAKYIADYERNGAGNVYTDAFFKLSDALKDPPDHKDDHRVWIMDWGILNSLALTHQGRLALRVGDAPFFTDHPSPDERKMIAYILQDREALFVGHVAEREIMKGVAKRLEEAFRGAGLHKEVLQTISDSNGRAVFEIYRLTPQP
jgi:4-amino-4-deoxy-L-arabinose transferase-like glycosyltransferase